MAVTHISFNDQTQHGRMIRRCLQELEEGRDILNDTVAVLGTMKQTGADGSQSAHWTYATSKFGFPDDATTLAAWNELNSLQIKLNTNGPITDMSNALTFAFDKFR